MIILERLVSLDKQGVAVCVCRNVVLIGKAGSANEHLGSRMGRGSAISECRDIHRTFARNTHSAGREARNAVWYGTLRETEAREVGRALYP